MTDSRFGESQVRFRKAAAAGFIEEVKLEPRPVIDDIPVEIPTLRRPILAKCLESIAQRILTGLRKAKAQ
jgi:hypothetical protein